MAANAGATEKIMMVKLVTIVQIFTFVCMTFSDKWAVLRQAHGTLMSITSQKFMLIVFPRVYWLRSPCGPSSGRSTRFAHLSAMRFCNRSTPDMATYCATLNKQLPCFLSRSAASN
jgi:hypothetical protein